MSSSSMVSSLDPYYSSFSAPPSAYDSKAYATSIIQANKNWECKLFDGIFSPDGEYFVVCNSFGIISGWRLGEYMTPEYWQNIEANINDDVAQNTGTVPASPAPSPAFSLQGHDAQIYCLEFGGSTSNPVLITGGDAEVRIWDWQSIIQSKPPSECLVHDIQHPQTSGIRGALNPLCETNDVAISHQTQHAFAAAGDGAAYEIDLHSGKSVNSFTGCHTDYLHSVTYVSSTSELVTASEDGTIGIWDVRSGKLTTKLSPSSNNFIASVATDSTEKWMTFGGGKKDGSNESVLGVYYLPTRTLTMMSSVKQASSSCIQHCSFYENEILAVGDQAELQYVNRSNGDIRASVSSTIPSIYFVSHDPKLEIVVAGGTSPYIDIFPTKTGLRGFSIQTI